ncbi:MAG: recombinase, partial [Muribaculaceae bacterium]|nr:recombinase [Muribaculaceae bacterium]
MANTRFYLDERGGKNDKPRVLKIAIAHKHKASYISLNVKILPDQWDSKKLRVVNHPDQMLMNVYISGVKQKIDTMLLTLAND